MATILMTWELGGGFGHMTRMREVGARLVARGHRVIAVLRDLYRAGPAFDGSCIQLLQAPFKQKSNAGESQPIISYAHILRNTAFGQIAELKVLASGWRGLFELVKPDVIVFDHSPTALLASRSNPAKRMIIGDGFEYPPDTSPLPDIRPWLKTDPSQLENDESHVLQNANAVLKDWSVEPMERLSQLYHPIEGVYMFTLEYLDPFATQRHVHYLSVAPVAGGELPEWPIGNGPKVFVYTKAFRTLPILLQTLEQFGAKVIAYAPEVGDDVKKKHNSPNIRFTTSPVDITQTAEQCDLAILNGTNGTVAQLLQTGKPMLNIPIVLNQDYNARAIEKLGAGLIASPDRPVEIVARLSELLGSDQYRAAAQKFADRHTPPSTDYQTVVDHVESLI